uniref:Protein kinase domain-containing protein n=1 Tax=Globisporangium ultimum (strain ATCC 200006 / CBS 805.95 / DAOM BR144) TaxID=431595 RepID=K3WFK5_GLOUD
MPTCCYSSLELVWMVKLEWKETWERWQNELMEVFEKEVNGIERLQSDLQAHVDQVEIVFLLHEYQVHGVFGRCSLLRTASATFVIQRAKSRKASLKDNVLHREIDGLLELLNVADIDPVHKWRPEIEMNASTDISLQRTHFFVCEYAGSGTLRDYLQREEDRRESWKKLYEIALGLQYLYEQNIVYNDLKGDNFLVKEGLLPARPESMSRDQWTLVEMMCYYFRSQQQLQGFG